MPKLAFILSRLIMFRVSTGSGEFMRGKKEWWGGISWKTKLVGKSGTTIIDDIMQHSPKEHVSCVWKYITVPKKELYSPFWRNLPESQNCTSHMEKTLTVCDVRFVSQGLWETTTEKQKTLQKSSTISLSFQFQTRTRRWAEFPRQSKQKALQ